MSSPSLNHGLHARAEQQLLLQPRMLQSIEVLQLPATDLEGWLERAAEENQALIVEAPRVDPGPRASRSAWEATQRHDDMLRNQPDRERRLSEALLEQLALVDLEREEEVWVRFLIGCLDEHGYLSLSDEELLEFAAESGLDADPTALGLAIARLQRLEPPGIGGRNMTEALLLQLDPAAEEYRLLCRLLEEFLDDIATNRLPRVARALGVELEELAHLLGELRGLDPRPGAELTATAAPVLRPDVVVERGENGGWSIRVERSSLPSVSLDPALVALAKDRGSTPEAKSWARERVERARWIVDAVGQRGATLLRVATAVFERQRAFLEEGPGHLRPLKMSDLAGELEIHVSTVSRAVSGKQVQTPSGIRPLRYFFQIAPGSSEGPARDDLREIVRGVFAGEDPTSPLSDGEVAEQLARKGHQMARRTVAKYRKELGIPSSYRRKQHT